METGYKGTDRMITGIVFGVITFWLFAQAMVNVVPAVQSDLGISMGTLNIAISVTALFSGMFIVAAGGLADKAGRKKIAYIGFVLSIIGSLCLVLAEGAPLLIAGRIIQGLSAACIMPSTIALIKAYFEGKERQRALSFWSIGSWGGSGVASFAGGVIATNLGWKWIFIFSIIFAVLGMFLLKDTPESKQESSGSFQFDFAGLSIFIVTMLALNIFITYGASFGWLSLQTLGILAVILAGLMIFVKVETGKKVVLIDFTLFKNKPYAGATASNFLLNGIAGTLVVANTYVQVGRGFTSFQSGMLSLGYLVAVLAMIRVGEKILQRVGAKKPIRGIEEEFGVKCELTYTPDYPPLYNDPQVTDKVRQWLEAANDKDIKEVKECPPISPSDDFAYYAKMVPSSYFFIGCTPKGVEKPVYNHNPKFDIDEDALLVAAKAVGQVVCGYYGLE